MKTILKKPLVRTIAAAVTIIGLSACGGGSTDVADTTASADATVNDSLVADAIVTIVVINDQGAQIDVSINAGTSGADGSVSVSFDTVTLASYDQDWPVLMVAEKTLPSGEMLHFETYMGSVADVLKYAVDGTVDMAREGDHPEISNIGMAKMEVMRALVAKHLADSGSSVNVDQLPSDMLYDGTLWAQVGAEMSETVLTAGVAVKAVVDYGAAIDTTNVPDYDADGDRDTLELVQKITEDAVAGVARTLDYYVIPDAANTAYDTFAKITADIKASVAADSNDPIYSYGQEFAGQGDFIDFAASGMDSLMDLQASFAEAKQQVSSLDCAGITVAEGDVYTVTLTYPDGAVVNFDYTALAGDGSTEVAAGLQAAIDAGAAFTATVSGDVVAITVDEAGVAVQINITSTGANAPTVDAGTAVMMDWAIPTSVGDYLTSTLDAAITTLETELGL